MYVRKTFDYLPVNIDVNLSNTITTYQSKAFMDSQEINKLIL